MDNTILGLILMLISTTIMSLGVTLQKKEVDKMSTFNETATTDNFKNVITNKMWILGWICTTGAILLQGIALGYADLTLIQPLLAFGLVMLAIFSYYYLGEKIARREILGMIIAIIGVIIIGITSEESREFTNVKMIRDVYLKNSTYFVFAVFFIIIFILWYYSTKILKYKDKGILFATIAAMFSILGLTLSKGLFSIINILGVSDTLKNVNAWILLILWISQSTMAIIFQNMAFQRGKSVVVNPIFNLCSIIFPIFIGTIIFNEEMNGTKILSTFIILIGAILISIRDKEILKNLENN